jgi:hypothetical protein
MTRHASDVRDGTQLMKLYHFINRKWGLAAIRDRQLKVSRLTELNDPFEMMGVSLASEQARKFMREVKEETGRGVGILCFSEVWQNPLMWSHYADRHRGFCLEFEVPADGAGPVTYVSERLPYPNAVTGKFLHELARTKFEHWNYERERRVLVDLDGAPPGHYFRGFGNDLRLTRVMVGSANNISRNALGEALGDYHDRVVRFKTRPAFKSFRVVENKNAKLWA